MISRPDQDDAQYHLARVVTPRKGWRPPQGPLPQSRHRGLTGSGRDENLNPGGSGGRRQKGSSIVSHSTFRLRPLPGRSVKSLGRVCRNLEVVKLGHRPALAAIGARPRKRRRPRSKHRRIDGLDASGYARRETALQRRAPARASEARDRYKPKEAAVSNRVFDCATGANTYGEVYADHHLIINCVVRWPAPTTQQVKIYR